MHLACWLACATFAACNQTPASTGSARPAAAVIAPGVPGTPRAQVAQSAQAKPKDRLFSAQDLGLLDAEDRDQWQRPDQIMDALKIAEGSVVADLGAGGGWFTIRLARRVEQNGLVIAEDIQRLMLLALRRRVDLEGLKNVRTVQGTPNDPKLPPDIDAALIVDAYHEMEDPADPSQVVTLLANIAKQLKPQGCLGVVDFEPGGGGPGPDPDERVNPDTVVRAAGAAGLTLLKREAVPPFQFLLVFGKTTTSSRCSS
jgi:predicted methyltransferase